MNFTPCLNIASNVKSTAFSTVAFDPKATPRPPCKKCIACFIKQCRFFFLLPSVFQTFVPLIKFDPCCCHAIPLTFLSVLSAPPSSRRFLHSFPFPAPYLPHHPSFIILLSSSFSVVYTAAVSVVLPSEFLAFCAHYLTSGFSPHNTAAITLFF